MARAFFTAIVLIVIGFLLGMLAGWAGNHPAASHHGANPRPAVTITATPDPVFYTAEITCPNGLVRNLVISPTSPRRGRLDCRRHHG